MDAAAIAFQRLNAQSSDLFRSVIWPECRSWSTFASVLKSQGNHPNVGDSL